MNRVLYLIAGLLIALSATSAFTPSSSRLLVRSVSRTTSSNAVLRMNSKDSDDLEETTRKYGLEAGLYKAVTAKPGETKVNAKDLLKKYGTAYLATSITLAIISYGLCFVAVSAGVDVASILEKIGIQYSTAAANTGTAAIAYAIHKALSPVRFPPTVVLTPVVAEWLGKKPTEDAEMKN